MNIINVKKTAAQHKLIQSFNLSLNVKLEFPMEKPTIFGYVDAEDSEPVNFWMNRGSVDNFHLNII